jgi:hypothetical protein
MNQDSNALPVRASLDSTTESHFDATRWAAQSDLVATAPDGSSGSFGSAAVVRPMHILLLLTFIVRSDEFKLELLDRNDSVEFHG